MVRYGKRAPHSRPSGAREAGPVLPWQPPSMFGQTTNHFSVSMYLPGPMMPLHQPAVGCPGPAEPIRWLSPVSACSTRIALLRSALSSPQDSYAMRADASVSLRSSASGPMDTNERLPGGSPSRQAPVAGGLPESALVLASVMKLEGTVSSGVCQSMSSSVSPTAPRRSCFITRHTRHRRGRLPEQVDRGEEVVLLRGYGARGGETGAEIGLDVVDVLESDREAHEPGRDTGSELLLRGQLRVRGRGRVDDEAAHVADVGDVAEQAHVVDEGAARIHTALEVERQNRADAARGILVRRAIPGARR